MKKGFANYLKTIEGTKSLIDRVRVIYEFYKKLCPEDIEDIFVTDYLTEDKTRNYENLWFFHAPTLWRLNSF